MADKFNPTKTELKQLFRRFSKGLKALRPEDVHSQTSCPDSWTLAKYVAGQSDEKTEQRINIHVAFCDSCFEDYVALVGPEKIMDLIRAHSPSDWFWSPEEVRARWEKLLEGGTDSVINLGQAYGVGTHVSSGRIVEEYPTPIPTGETISPLDRLILRGLYGDTVEVSKVLEVSIGKNLYKARVAVKSDGTHSWDITDLRIALQSPLDIWILATDDVADPSRYATTHVTDASGEFFVPGIQEFRYPNVKLLLLVLEHEAEERLVCFRVPEISPLSANDLLADVLAVSSERDLEDQLDRITEWLTFLRMKLKHEMRPPTSTPSPVKKDV